MELHSFVFSAVMLLFVSSIAVAVSKRLGLGSILGLLITGIIVGPYSPGPYLTLQVDDVRHFTELGVVFLLFIIGLEIRPARLWQMRKDVFGLGSLQVILTGFAIAYYVSFSHSLEKSLVIGFSLALSSTAFVMQLLQEKGEIASNHGSQAFAVLLMQDLAIVPLLAMIPILSNVGTLSADVPVINQIGIVIGSILIVFVFARYFIPFMLERLARQNNREAFLMIVLLAVFFSAWAMNKAGLSMALGSFMTGMLLSNSQYHWKIEALIEPYKGLLMSLFFVSVGMSIDLNAVIDKPVYFSNFIAIVILIKLAILLLLALLFKLDKVTAIKFSFLLAQGGEFGFVLLGSAKALDVINANDFVSGVCIISVSMLLTPLLVKLGDKLSQKFATKADKASVSLRYNQDKDEDIASNRVIVGGYGRVGHAVAVMLHASNIPIIVFDTNPLRVRQGKKDGLPVYYGDISSPELMQAVHCENASLVLLTLNDVDASVKSVYHIRKDYPNIPIVARAHDLASCTKLTDAGATEVYPEAVESSLRLGAIVMNMVGSPKDNVDILLHDVRKENYSLISEEPRS